MWRKKRITTHGGAWKISFYNLTKRQSLSDYIEAERERERESEKRGRERWVRYFFQRTKLIRGSYVKNSANGFILDMRVLMSRLFIASWPILEAIIAETKRRLTTRFIAHELEQIRSADSLIAIVLIFSAIFSRTIRRLFRIQNPPRLKHAYYFSLSVIVRLSNSNLSIFIHNAHNANR